MGKCILSLYYWSKAFKTIILEVPILITAAKNVYTDVVKKILEHGADINTKDKRG